MSKPPRSRAWCLTLWSREDVARLESLETSALVVGEETCPSTGKLHFHAYVRFKHARSFASLHVQFPNVHIEAPRQSEAKCVEYCLKDGKVVVDRRGVVLDGVAPKKSGEVEVEVHRRLAEGETIRSIWADHPIYCARNMRMLRSVVRVYSLWGHRTDELSEDNLSGVEL